VTLVRYEVPVEGVAVVTLARPEARNAQNVAMLHEVDDAFTRASADDDIRVIVLAADGPHFSAGHDLSEYPKASVDRRVTCWAGFDRPGIEGFMASEEELFIGLCWRWRNLPKPTIAAVNGKAIAGGLMLASCCDLIVAAEDAEFSDPVVAFGVNGNEFFTHLWEFGPRWAKEVLFAGRAVTADEALALHMVNHVVPLDELLPFTLELAARVARRPAFGLTLAKQAVNQALEAQGMWAAVQSAYTLHALGHAHNFHQSGGPVLRGAARSIRDRK
jgi:enoyl-CoA hydratase